MTNLQNTVRHCLVLLAVSLLWQTPPSKADHDSDHGQDNVMPNTEVQKELVCFNGFVMDNFCIRRGTLLDAPSVRTLERPNVHSVHCLVDIGNCRRDGYELLMDPPSGGMYGRAFRLDDTGNQMVIDLARQVGDCSTCTGEGNQVGGFRATVVGYRSDGPAPQLLEVVEMRRDNEPCMMEEGGQFVPMNVSFTTGNEEGVDPVSLHGSIMVAAWGVLIPVGVLSSRFLRHKPNNMWFVLHRVCNGLALVLTGIGILYAFVKFGNVLTKDSPQPSYRHGSLGMTTFALGCVQAIVGIFRPHLPEGNEDKTTARFAFEVTHKSLGYITVALAYTTLYFGADIAGTKRDAFMSVWYGLLGLAFAIGAWMFWDQYTFNRQNKLKQRQQKETGQHKHGKGLEKDETDLEQSLERPNDE